MTGRAVGTRDRARYLERVQAQTLAWAQGRPYHNAVDGECCPDFSCCDPASFNADEAARWAHYHEQHGRRS